MHEKDMSGGKHRQTLLPRHTQFLLCHNATVTVKVSLHIRACGKGSGAIRGFPSCSCIRQQCGQTLHSVLFFQMCLVLNSTSHNRECSEGLTVDTHTHTQTRAHTHTHTRTHTHTHTHTPCTYTQLQKLTLPYHK